MQINSSDTNVPLELTVSKFSVGYVDGLTPTVAIRKTGTSPIQYLDWATNTFKTSGWTTKYQNMSESEHGHYEAIWNASTSGLAASDRLIAEYLAIIDGVPYPSHEDIFVTNTENQVTFLRKLGKNKLIQQSGNPGILTLFDDDGTTQLEQWSLNDEDGGAVLPATGTPARRSAGTP